MSKWISVKEKLPDESIGCCLCWVRGDEYQSQVVPGVNVLAWDELAKRFFILCNHDYGCDCKYFNSDKVTHWQKLPDAPKEAE